jgi:hypothetical protein
MVPVNQLRLGNYFHPCSIKEDIIIPNTTIVWKVGMIDKFGKIAVIEPENHETLYLTANEAEPIPLTEEWLLNFGGKPLENGYWISIYNLKAEFHFELFKNTDEIITTIKSQFADLILDRIKYVHQLQNLYFALTNEELTIK